MKPLVAVGALGALVMGCAAENASPATVPHPSNGLSDSSRDSFVETPLPGFVVETSYALPGPAPSLCTWATSVDAVVWGELVDLRLVAEPLVQQPRSPDEGSWEWTERCENGVEAVWPALELDILVKSAPRGPLDPGQTVTVHAGHYRRIAFDPLPAATPGETIQWLSGTGNSDGQALSIGQQIGIAAHYIPEHQAWSLMGESLFGVRSDGRVKYQAAQGGALFEAPPQNSDQLSFQAFVEQVTACSPTDEGAARRTIMWNSWGPRVSGDRAGTGNPANYIAGYCFRDELKAANCETDADCSYPETCVVGSCTDCVNDPCECGLCDEE